MSSSKLLAASDLLTCQGKAEGGANLQWNRKGRAIRSVPQAGDLEKR